MDAMRLRNLRARKEKGRNQGGLGQNPDRTRQIPVGGGRNLPDEEVFPVNSARLMVMLLRTTAHAMDLWLIKADIFIYCV